MISGEKRETNFFSGEKAKEWWKNIATARTLMQLFQNSIENWDLSR